MRVALRTIAVFLSSRWRTVLAHLRERSRRRAWRHPRAVGGTIRRRLDGVDGRAPAARCRSTAGADAKRVRRNDPQRLRGNFAPGTRSSAPTLDEAAFGSTTASTQNSCSRARHDRFYDTSLKFISAPRSGEGHDQYLVEARGLSLQPARQRISLERRLCALRRASSECARHLPWGDQLAVFVLWAGQRADAAIACDALLFMRTPIRWRHDHAEGRSNIQIRRTLLMAERCPQTSPAFDAQGHVDAEARYRRHCARNSPAAAHYYHRRLTPDGKLRLDRRDLDFDRQCPAWVASRHSISASTASLRQGRLPNYDDVWVDWQVNQPSSGGVVGSVGRRAGCTSR